MREERNEKKRVQGKVVMDRNIRNISFFIKNLSNRYGKRQDQ